MSGLISTMAGTQMVFFLVCFNNYSMESALENGSQLQYDQDEVEGKKRSNSAKIKNKHSSHRLIFDGLCFVCSFKSSWKNS